MCVCNLMTDVHVWICYICTAAICAFVASNNADKSTISCCIIPELLAMHCCMLIPLLLFEDLNLEFIILKLQVQVNLSGIVCYPTTACESEFLGILAYKDHPLVCGLSEINA